MQGDEPSDYQPPTFLFAFRNAPMDLSNMFATWIPWTNGNPRAPGSVNWATYDAMTTGTWRISSIGAAYASFAAMVSANPELTFMSDAELAAYYPDYPGRALNVGLGNYGPGERDFFSSARGGVDWLEVGVDENVTRWDLNKVAEPGSILCLSTGLIGLLGCIRRGR